MLYRATCCRNGTDRRLNEWHGLSGGRHGLVFPIADRPLIPSNGQRRYAAMTFGGSHAGHVIVAALSTCLIFSFSQTAFAQKPCACWIDVKTGKLVVTVPAGDARLSLDGKTAFNPKTGQNYALEPYLPPKEKTTGLFTGRGDYLPQCLSPSGQYPARLPLRAQRLERSLRLLRASR